jgi:hypothetical protein
LATREDRSLPAAAPTETERLVAWLRVPAIVLIGAGHGISSPQERGFNVALALFGIWAGCLLAWVYLRPVTARFALIATAADIVAITALVFLSGGAFSEARAAYFLVPVAVAFRFRPPLTALAGGAAIVAYLIQALADSNSNRPHAARSRPHRLPHLDHRRCGAPLLSARATDTADRRARRGQPAAGGRGAAGGGARASVACRGTP